MHICITALSIKALSILTEKIKRQPSIHYSYQLLVWVSSLLGRSSLLIAGVSFRDAES